MKKILVIVIGILFIGMSVVPPIGGIGGNHYNLVDNKTEAISETNSTDNEAEYHALLIYAGTYAGRPDQNFPPEHLELFEEFHDKLLISKHWKEENIKVIRGRGATLLNIIGGFRWLEKREDENDISLVYFSTHGGQLKRDKWPFEEEDKKDEVLATYLCYLFPWLNIRDDLLSLLLSRLHSKGLCVVVDSCHAGGFNDTLFYKSSLESQRISAEEWNYELSQELSESGRVILMACREDEIAWGGFTMFLTEGLTGYADVNENELVSAEEAFYYAKERYDWEEYNVHATILDDYPGELELTIVEFPPSVPVTPMGEDIGDVDTYYNYSTVSTDPAGDKISYGWDWDDDYIVDEWTDFIESNSTVNISHSWTEEGIYNLRVIAKDENGLLSDWSNHIVVIMCDDNTPDQQQTMIHSGVGISGCWGAAMSFVPSLSTLSKVDLGLFLYLYGEPTLLPVYIRENLSGDNLAEASIDIPKMEDLHMTRWFTFDFQDIEVIPGNKYYIIIKTVDGCAEYWKSGKGNCYPSGRSYWSSDGEEWHADGPDCCFVTWGKIE